jgi:hypothetical protein
LITFSSFFPSCSSLPSVVLLLLSAPDAGRFSSTTAPQTPPASRTITSIRASTTPGSTPQTFAGSPWRPRRRAGCRGGHRPRRLGRAAKHAHRVARETRGSCGGGGGGGGLPIFLAYGRSRPLAALGRTCCPSRKPYDLSLLSRRRRRARIRRHDDGCGRQVCTHDIDVHDAVRRWRTDGRILDYARAPALSLHASLWMGHKLGRLRCDEDRRARRRECEEFARRREARRPSRLLGRQWDAEHGGVDEDMLAAVTGVDAETRGGASHTDVT